MLSLNLTLRIVAVIMLLIIATQFAYLEALQIKPFIAANILFLLSVVELSSVKKKAFLCLLLSVIIPLGAFQEFLSGAILIEVMIVYIVMFTLLGYASVEEIRKNIM